MRRVIAMLAVAQAQPRHSSAYRCCVDRHSRIGIWNFSLAPINSYDNATRTWSGYLADRIQMLSDELGFSYELVGVPTINPWLRNKDGISDAWSPAGGVLSGTLDTELISDSSDLPSHNLSSLLLDPRFAYTSSLITTSMGALVHTTTRPPSIWQLFEPFDNKLWVAIVSALLGYAMLLVLLSGALSRCSRRNPTAPLTNMVSSSYHTVSACFGGEDYEWISGPMRLLRLSLLAFVLVTGSCYTANLAAFFNRSNVEIRGPKDAKGFKASVVCIARELASQIHPYVSGVVRIGGIHDKTDEAEVALEHLRTGTCDAWVNNRYYLQSQHLQRCETTRLLSFVDIIPLSFKLLLREDEKRLAAQISAALAFIDQARSSFHCLTPL